MGVTDRRRAKVEARVRPELQADERIEATLSFVQTGPTPWFALLTFLIFFWIRYYAVVVTDQRVLVIKRSTLLNRVLDVESTYERSEVSVADYQPPTVWGKLTLSYRASPIQYNVHRLHKQEADALVGTLGGVTASPPAAPPPTV